MKLGIIITQTDPETVFNALRLAQYALKEGDKVRIFLSGRGVEMDQSIKRKDHFFNGLATRTRSARRRSLDGFETMLRNESKGFVSGVGFPLCG